MGPKGGMKFSHLAEKLPMNNHRGLFDGNRIARGKEENGVHNLQEDGEYCRYQFQQA
jgi:hypothetical protein